MMPSRTGIDGLGTKSGRTFKKTFKSTLGGARRNFKEDNFPEIIPPELSETKL